MKILLRVLPAAAWMMGSVIAAAPPLLPASEPKPPPGGLSARDWSGICAAHAAWDHSFHQVAGGQVARHRGHQWRGRFDSRGFVVTSDDGRWQWGLELHAYGFPGTTRKRTDSAGSAVEGGARLTRTWDYNLQEWYVNDPQGLEHGFTISRRPDGSGNAASLVIDLTVRGSLWPHVRPGGGATEFRDAEERTVLTYDGLKVFDADGRIVPARMAVPEPGTLRLEVDESGARYPLTIDPVAAPVYVKALNAGGGDSFGQSVAISGDTVVVGAHLEDGDGVGVNPQDNNTLGESGAVYVFVRSTAGTWSQQAYLKSTNPGLGDFFGRSVSISGETLVVGAPYEDGSGTGVNPTPNNNADQAGAAYVFFRNTGTWTPAGYLKASNTQLNDQFGISVAVSGNVIVVGAPLEDGSGPGLNPQVNEGASAAGAAYLFVYNGSAWVPDGYVKASNPGADDNFGYSVAISGDTMVIGAYLEDGGGAGTGDSGAAYVFRRTGAIWNQEAYLRASNPGVNDWFGHSVAVSGNTVVCGAPAEDGGGTGVNPPDISGGFDSGAVYVFHRSGVVWSQQAYLKASNTGVSDQFGFSVALLEDTLGVGAPREDGNGTGVNPPTSEGNSDSGAAYVFSGRSGAWIQTAYVKATNPGADDLFGYSVAVGTQVLVAGATSEDGGGAGINPPDTSFRAGSGAAYIFNGVTPLRDADGDGIADAFETYFGTDPDFSNPLPWTVTSGANQLILRWPEADTTGVTVVPQWSPDMITWLVSGETRNGIPARTITVAPAGGIFREATLNTSGLTRASMRLRMTCP